MDIKIVCGCGQKYIFEVDPENGQMPAAVNCPVCGADGTREANDIMAQIFPDQPADPAVEPAVEPVVETAAPAPAAASAGPLRISVPSAPAGPPPLPADRPVPQPIRPLTAATPAAKDTGAFSLGLGILGTVLGAGVGAGLMYAFFSFTGFRFPLMGVGIGALSGYGARLLGRGTDTTLGVVAAVLALAANAGTLYLMFGDFAFAYVISLAIGAWFAYRVASG